MSYTESKPGTREASFLENSLSLNVTERADYLLEPWLAYTLRPNQKERPYSPHVGLQTSGLEKRLPSYRAIIE